MIKKLSLLIAALASIAFLSGCSAGDNAPTFDQDQTAQVFNVKLSDGRTIPCIMLKKGTGHSSYGGPSCDWSKK